MDEAVRDHIRSLDTDELYEYLRETTRAGQYGKAKAAEVELARRLQS